MPGKRISPEIHAHIKILSEEGYSTRQISARLRLAQKTVSRSISNFKTTGNYGYKKPTGRPCTFHKNERYSDPDYLNLNLQVQHKHDTSECAEEEEEEEDKHEISEDAQVTIKCEPDINEFNLQGDKPSSYKEQLESTLKHEPDTHDNDEIESEFEIEHEDKSIEKISSEVFPVDVTNEHTTKSEGIFPLKLKLKHEPHTSRFNEEEFPASKKKQKPFAKYKMHSEESKFQLLESYKQGGDWMAVATANNIPIRSARRIISKGTYRNKARGGARHKKISEAMIIRLIQVMEENKSITRREMALIIYGEFGVEVTQQCISSHLNGLCYSVNNVRELSAQINSTIAIEKRKVFCAQLREAKMAENIIIYLDETNFNIFTTRSKAFAKKGEKAGITVHNTRPPSIYVLCAVSSFGPGCLHVKCTRGNINSHMFTNFVQETLQAVERLTAESTSLNITLVMNNVPDDGDAEIKINTANGRVQILRIEPYSPQLNPLEGCFAVYKSEVKRLLKDQRLFYDYNRSCDPIISEHKFQILEETAQKATDSITPELVLNYERQCEKAIERAINGEPMEMGV